MINLTEKVWLGSRESCCAETDLAKYLHLAFQLIFTLRNEFFRPELYHKHWHHLFIQSQLWKAKPDLNQQEERCLTQASLRFTSITRVKIFGSGLWNLSGWRTQVNIYIQGFTSVNSCVILLLTILVRARHPLNTLLLWVRGVRPFHQKSHCQHLNFQWQHKTQNWM